MYKNQSQPMQMPHVELQPMQQQYGVCTSQYIQHIQMLQAPSPSFLNRMNHC